MCGQPQFPSPRAHQTGKKFLCFRKECGKRIVLTHSLEVGPPPPGLHPACHTGARSRIEQHRKRTKRRTVEAIVAVRWLLKAISRFGRAAVDPRFVGIDPGIAGSPT